MSARNKGTREEIAELRKLVRNNALKTSPQHRHVWAQMCKGAALDAKYHCTLTAKALQKTKIEAFQDLHVPDVTAPVFQLTLPSLAFVALKMYKTIEVKFGRAGRGNLNLSHSNDWAILVEELHDYVCTPDIRNHPQILDPTKIYSPLSTDELIAIRIHKVARGDTTAADVLIPSDDEEDILNVN